MNSLPLVLLYLTSNYSIISYENIFFIYAHFSYYR
jgi:hypothetical protein